MSEPSTSAGARGLAASPPPHDPSERALVCKLGAWEFRAFPPDDPKHRYFATRELLHLQLWHPDARVSLLTPSRLTAGAFELFPVDGWKCVVRSAEEARRLARYAHGVELPSPLRLAALIEWYVRSEERRASQPRVEEEEG
jgi:hypothetical protein